MNTSLKGPFFILIACLCFATSGLAQAFAPEAASSFHTGAIRLLFGGFVLFIWCTWRKKLPKRGTWPLRDLFLAVIGLVVFQLAFFLGLTYAGLAAGTVISIGFSPIAAAIFSWIMRGEKPEKLWYPATFVAILGLLLMNITNMKLGNILTLLLPLIAGIAYGLNLVAYKSLIAENEPETVMMVVGLLGALLLLPTFFLFPSSWIFTLDGMLFSSYLGIITFATAYSLLLVGLKYTTSIMASTLALMEPLFAAIFGFAILHESMNFLSILGITCILASSIILVFPPSKKDVPVLK